MRCFNHFEVYIQLLMKNVYEFIYSHALLIIVLRVIDTASDNK